MNAAQEHFPERWTVVELDEYEQGIIRERISRVRYFGDAIRGLADNLKANSSRTVFVPQTSVVTNDSRAAILSAANSVSDVMMMGGSLEDVNPDWGALILREDEEVGMFTLADLPPSITDYMISDAPIGYVRVERTQDERRVTIGSLDFQAGTNCALLL